MLLLVNLTATCLVASAGAAPWIGVRGNRLVDAQGQTVRLLGVNRSGAEYSCQQGYGFFDGPSGAASIRAMKSWQVNAVRLPLNETCWLGSAPVTRPTPEMGEGDCRDRYIDPYMAWADRHGVFYLGWALDAFGGWTCHSGPT